MPERGRARLFPSPGRRTLGAQRAAQAQAASVSGNILKICINFRISVLRPQKAFGRISYRKTGIRALEGDFEKTHVLSVCYLYKGLHVPVPGQNQSARGIVRLQKLPGDYGKSRRESPGDPLSALDGGVIHALVQAFFFRRCKARSEDNVSRLPGRQDTRCFPSFRQGFLSRSRELLGAEQAAV